MCWPCGNGKSKRSCALESTGADLHFRWMFATPCRLLERMLGVTDGSQLCAGRLTTVDAKDMTLLGTRHLMGPDGMLQRPLMGVCAAPWNAFKNQVAHNIILVST